MAQKDPFEIGKVDGAGSGGGVGGVSPSYTPPVGGAANRIGEGGGASGVAGTQAASGITDKVQLSPEVGDTDDDNTVKDQNLSSLISALKAPEQVASTQKVNEVNDAAAIQTGGGGPPRSNYDPGMQAGAVYGSNGSVAGVQPGMQAGAVHSTRPQSV